MDIEISGVLPRCHCHEWQCIWNMYKISRCVPSRAGECLLANRCNVWRISERCPVTGPDQGLAPNLQNITLCMYIYDPTLSIPISFPDLKCCQVRRGFRLSGYWNPWCTLWNDVQIGTDVSVRYKQMTNHVVVVFDVAKTRHLDKEWREVHSMHGEAHQGSMATHNTHRWPNARSWWKAC